MNLSKHYILFGFFYKLKNLLDTEIDSGFTKIRTSAARMSYILYMLLYCMFLVFFKIWEFEYKQQSSKYIPPETCFTILNFSNRRYHLGCFHEAECILYC